MKTIKVKKLFNGNVSLRDYVVREHIQKNEPIEVMLGDKRMMITVEMMRRAKATSEVFQSKWSAQRYQLMDFLWKPTEQQLNLV